MNSSDRRRALPFAWTFVVGLAVLLIPGVVLARVTLPARIQAEDYDSQSGAYTTTTADVDGGDDLYCMDNPDWTEYEVYVPSAGDYTITVRVRMNNSGDYFRIEIDDEDVTGTIGPDNWGVYEDVVVEDVELDAGSHTLKYYQVVNWNWNDRINWIQVDAENAAPSVDAGANDTVTYPSAATLDGTVSDDGLPASPGTYTVTWTTQSGPGTVTFSNSSAVDTTAAFSTSGTYVLRLTAGDGELTDYDEVTIEANAAPSVDAGSNALITWPADETNLDGTVSDDGLPSSPGTYTVTWTMQSGPGTVTFTNASAEDTTAEFSASGTYVLRLTVGDGDTTAYDDVTIEVNAAPSVDAGSDDVITWPTDEVNLDATVSDDGLPSSPGTYTVTWTMQSGSGTVTFTNANAVDTTAEFSASGTYVLRLTVGDGDTTAYDDITVEVNAAPSVDAGSNDTITLPSNATLDGTVTDDSLPSSPGTYTVTWTKQSGAGTVTFGNSSAVDTTAAFSASGTYVLRLTAGDGDTTDYDDVTITVNSSGGGITLPARIQAEDYDSQSGTGTTTTDDVDGGDDVYGTDAGDWMEYEVYVPSTGDYTFTVRARSCSEGDFFRIEIDDEDVTGTIGPDNWGVYEDVVVEDVELEAGSHTLKYYQVVNWNWNDRINWIEVESEGGNSAPSVNAGSDDLITWPTDEVDLDATVSDDGLPASPGTYTVTWTKQSGPGTVTFTNASAEDTTAEFSASGTYVLRLTADDGDLTDYDDVTIEVNAAPNVDAGSNDTITLPSNATLDGTVTDDSLPSSPGTYAVTWTKQSGAGTVTFGNASAVDTTAAFSASGTYVLRLTAGDGDTTAYDEVQITVNSSGGNSAPTVDAGLTDAVNLSDYATLDATVTDDSLPNPPATYTVTWTKQSGPGTVTFGSTSVEDTTATFGSTGTYVLRLTANDSSLTAYDEVTVVVVSNSTFVLPCKVEVEDYRDGGEGVGYHDSSGTPDVSTCSDTGGGDCLYYFEETEWTAYDIYVPEDGYFKFTLRATGSLDLQSAYVLIDDDADTVGCFRFIASYDYPDPEVYTDVVIDGVFLTAGSHVMKLLPQSYHWSFAINYINIESSQDGPVVDAGSDQAITLPTVLSLDATVTDNGLPDPPDEFTVRWIVVSEPCYGVVDFGDRRAVDTTASFNYPGTYVLRLIADDSLAKSYDDVTVTVTEATDRIALPGRLEAEDYADQGEGVSYYDTTSGNAGSTYRSDDVDIEACGDTGGGYDVSWIVADEWLGFDVAVSADTACYDVVARVSSTTSSRQIHVEVDGVDVTGAMTFDSTGGWTDVTAEGIHLTLGRHTVKIVMDTGDFKLNYVDFLAESYEEYIVEDGVANADIVISSNPFTTAALAADELQEFIEDITGATLPIVTTPTGADVHIYVGRSSYTDALGITTDGLQYDAFKMVSGSDWMALIGNDTDYVPIEPTTESTEDMEDWDEITGSTYRNPMTQNTRNYSTSMDLWQSDACGSLQAVYEFLRDLGCRWYYPGTIGEVIPSLDDIGLPEVNRTVEPDFPLRHMMIYHHEFGTANAENVKWQLRLGLNMGQDVQGWILSHGTGYVITREEMKIAHPEYYALINGERDTEGWSGSGNPCASSTGLMAENVNFLECVFDHYGEPMCDVSPPDGYSICQCELCAGKDSPERGQAGSHSDYIHGYANDVASEVYLTYPDRKISVQAYASYHMPPLDIEEFSPNVVVNYNYWMTWLYEKDGWEDYMSELDDWLEILPSNQIIISDFYLHNMTYKDPGNPVYFPRLLKQELSQYATDGTCLGKFIEVGWEWELDEYPSTALEADHLNIYVTSRLQWNAKLDLPALLDDYYEKFYGPAADEMKEFVEYCEANYEFPLTTSSIITAMRTKLNAAITAASGSGIYADRVDMMDEYLSIIEE